MCTMQWTKRGRGFLIRIWMLVLIFKRSKNQIRILFQYVWNLFRLMKQKIHSSNLVAVMWPRFDRNETFRLRYEDH